MLTQILKYFTTILVVVFIGNEIDLESQTFTIKIENQISLSDLVKETSGLIKFDGKIITHNDSGGAPCLYELNSETGAIERTVCIKGVKNIDMEALTQDKDFIYLCDIGNNLNMRKDQTIYKIAKKDYLNKNEVTAEKIGISYPEQTDFSKSNYRTNFDAEAVVAYQDKLLLFTKNWSNFKTDIYEVPKQAGKYNLKHVGNIDVKGMVTDGCYDAKNDRIVLIGYANYKPFLGVIDQIKMENDSFEGNLKKGNLSLTGSKQTEGIAHIEGNKFKISAEASNGQPATLYTVTID